MPFPDIARPALRWALASLVAAGAAAGEPLDTRLESAGRAGERTAIAIGLEPAAERRLAAAWALALDRLAAEPMCRALFDPLSRDGRSSLGGARYRPATGREERLLCRRSTTAFTNVGSPITGLCRSFSRLPPPRAAAVLLHEALHFAGLPEAPLVAGAPSSAEINHTVAESCAL